MAQKGLFFNAFPNPDYETGYDRNYSADDISNWLKVLITTGVVKTDNVAGTGEPQGLKVVAVSGMTVKINAGLAVINGKPFINDSQHTSNIPTAPTSGTAYEGYFIRYNNEQTMSGRKIAFSRRRLDHIPTLADCTRTDDIYDLCFAYVEVRANVTSIQQSDIHDLRGDAELCPWVTAVKGYENYYDAIVQRFDSDITLTSAGKVVVTDLAVSLYNEKYSLVSVYCNGLREDEEDYSVDASNEYITITFNANKSAKAQISVILENFIDGEGLENVMAQYNELVQEVANLKKLNEYNYYCTGDDNVKISNLVKNLIEENDSNIAMTIKINVIGEFGETTPAGGDGSASNPYKIFDFGSNDGNIKFILDFANCSQLYIAGFTNKTTIIFNGSGGQILNANLISLNIASNTIVKGFSSGRWLVRNSRFDIYGYKDTILAYSGTFENCRGEVYNVYGSSWCFFPRSGELIRVIGGEYKAYTQDGSGRSAVLGQPQTGNSVFFGVNVPTVAKSGYYQTDAFVHQAGKFVSVGAITALNIERASSGSSVSGTIQVSLPDETW